MPVDSPSKRKATPPSRMTARKKHVLQAGPKYPDSKTPSEAIASVPANDFSIVNTVTLSVGQDEQEMFIRGSDLARDSGFFATAMEKEWKEGQARTIKIPEERPDTMAHYLHYAARGLLFTEDITQVDGKGIESCYQQLCFLYVAGERFMNRSLQNRAVEEIVRLTGILDNCGVHWFPTGEEVNIVYRGTPQGSPGRQLMVDLQVVMGVKDWMDFDLEVDFLKDVAKALLDKVEDLDFREVELQADNYML